MVYFLSIFCIAIGLVGFLSATIGVPIVVALFSLVNRARGPKKPTALCLEPAQSIEGSSVTFSSQQFDSDPISIGIVIPVFNSARELSITLPRVLDAIEICKKQVAVECRVVVVDDGSTDDSSNVAESCGVEVLRLPTNGGKWNALVEGIQAHLGDESPGRNPTWIGLVDSGVSWPRDFLLRLVSRMRVSELAGIAPRYKDERGGVVGGLLWSFESWLKRLESLGRGPVSVHGATVFYRASSLKEPMRILRGDSWINDDVVLPLLVRACNPDQRIQYANDLMVYDQSAPPSKSSSKARRVRMVAGNVQWLKKLVPEIMSRDPGTLFVLLRRIGRIFWAYWAVCLMLGLAMFTFTAVFSPSPVMFELALVVAIGFFCCGFLLCRSAAARASLSAPFVFFPITTTPSRTMGGVKWG